MTTRRIGLVKTTMVTESDVHMIVDDAFDKYERDVAHPRHKENSELMKENGAKLDHLMSLQDKLVGGVMALKWIGGVLVFVVGMAKLIAIIRGYR